MTETIKMWKPIWRLVLGSAKPPDDIVDLQLAVNEALYAQEKELTIDTPSLLFKEMYAASRSAFVRQYQKVRFDRTDLFAFFGCTTWQGLKERLPDHVRTFAIVLNLNLALEHFSLVDKIINKFKFDTGDYTSLEVTTGSIEQTITDHYDKLLDKCGLLISPDWSYERRRTVLREFIFQGKNFIKIKMTNQQEKQKPQHRSNLISVGEEGLRPSFNRELPRPGFDRELSYPDISPLNISPYRPSSYNRQVSQLDQIREEPRFEARRTREGQNFPMLDSPPPRQQGQFRSPAYIPSFPFEDDWLMSSGPRYTGRLGQELLLFSHAQLRDMAVTRGMTPPAYNIHTIIQWLTVTTQDVPMRYTYQELNGFDQWAELGRLRNIQFSYSFPTNIQIALNNDLIVDEKDAPYFHFTDEDLFRFAQHHNMAQVTENMAREHKVNTILAELKERKSLGKYLGGEAEAGDFIQLKKMVVDQCRVKFNNMTDEILNQVLTETTTETAHRFFDRQQKVDIAVMNCIKNATNLVTNKEIIMANMLNTPSEHLKAFIEGRSFIDGRSQEFSRPPQEVFPRQSYEVNQNFAQAPQRRQLSESYYARSREFSKIPQADIAPLLREMGIDEPGKYQWWALITELYRNLPDPDATFEMLQKHLKDIKDDSLIEFLNSEQEAARQNPDQKFQIANMAMILGMSLKTNGKTIPQQLTNMGDADAMVQLQNRVGGMNASNTRPYQLEAMRYFYKQPRTANLQKIQDYVNAQNYEADSTDA